MHSAKHRLLIHAALLLLACTSAGCGSERAKTASVKGTVTFRGKPVPNGTVTFIPSGPGPAATGEIQKDGSFTLTTYRPGDGAVLGTHKVIVVAVEDTSTRLPEERNPLPSSIVPDKYTSAATSDLSAEVKEGENVVVFDLKDDRNR
jgi:hypothetical protein